MKLSKTNPRNDINENSMGWEENDIKENGFIFYERTRMVRFSGSVM